MKVITIASGKGGSSKTTCTATLAVRAAKESDRVALMDLNEDQGSLTDWWHARRCPKNPDLIDVEDVAGDVEAARKNGVEWLFIDTPPLGMGLIEAAIAVASLVVIPVRASLMDINATKGVISSCRKYRRPFVFLLAAVDSGMPKLADQAGPLLLMMARPGGSIMPAKVHMSHRQSYVQAMAAGRTAPEIAKQAKDTVVVGEVDKIWVEVQRLAESSRRAAE